MTEGTKQFGDRVIGGIFAAAAAWSAMATIAEVIHGKPNWWLWAIIALIGTRVSWVCFRDAKTPAKPAASVL